MRIAQKQVQPKILNNTQFDCEVIVAHNILCGVSAAFRINAAYPPETNLDINFWMFLDRKSTRLKPT